MSNQKITQSIFHDLVKLKKMETLIRPSKCELEDILNAITDMITIYDKDFNIIYANTAAKEILYANTAAKEILKLPPPLLAKTKAKCYNYYHGTGCPPEGCPTLECFKTGMPAVFELFEPNLNRTIEIRVIPRFDSNKELIGIINIVKDITQHKQSEEKLRGLTSHLLSVREEERKNVAREIHDELGQILTAIKMDIFYLNKKLSKDQKPLLEKTKSMMELIDMTIYTVQRISSELRPGLLDDFGIQAAIEWQVREFQNRSGIKCKVNFSFDISNLDQECAVMIFRIFQESLTNVVRHAKATEIEVSLKENHGNLIMEVRDNGRGVTEDQISSPKSFGLIGMQERVHFFGGSIKITGVKDKKTTVTVTVPLDSR